MEIPNEVQAFLMIVLLSLLPIAGAAAAALVLKAKSAGSAFIQQNFPEDVLRLMQAGAEMAVKAAEQSGLAELIVNEGKNKKQFAINWLQDFLNSQGLGGIDVSVLSGAVEAAVFESFGGKPKAITPEG